MADEELEMDQPFPTITVDPTATAPEKPKRGRGRPKGSKNRGSRGPSFIPAARDIEDADKLISEKAGKLSAKFQLALVQGTSIVGTLVPPISMRPIEAKNISDPLASYLYRNGELGDRARELVERWDLVALSLALAMYDIRVYKDFIKWRKEVDAERSNNREPISEQSTVGGNAGGSVGRSSTEIGRSGGRENPNGERQETEVAGPDETPSFGSLPNLVGDFPGLSTPEVPTI
jgi:hypothetical protein